MNFNGTIVSAVLVVFYLYLLVRPQHVKRPRIYWVGVWALVAALASQYFLMGRKTVKVAMVLDITASLVAFVAGVFACYAGRLPFALPSGLSQEPPASEKSDAPTPPQE